MKQLGQGCTNLSSNSLSNLLKASLVMEFESPACALSWRNRHTLVKVGCGLQVISRLLLQLLAELLSLYCSNVSYTGKEKCFVEYQNKK